MYREHSGITLSVLKVTVIKTSDGKPELINAHSHVLRMHNVLGQGWKSARKISPSIPGALFQGTIYFYSTTQQIFSFIIFTQHLQSCLYWSL